VDNIMPPYAPNVVNQTVTYNGRTFKGNPGSGWTDVTEQQAANDAQTAYQAGIGSAVSTLQTAGTNLDTQYGDLLSKVMGQGTVAMNTVTTGENNLLGIRGITNNSPLYSQQMGSAQLPVQVANQAAVGSLGYTEAGLQTGLAGNIAGIQAGAAGTMANLPLSYGSLALSQAYLPTQIQLGTSQAENYSAALANALKIAGLQYGEPFNTYGQVYNPATGAFKVGGGSGTPSMEELLTNYFSSKQPKRQPMSSIGKLVN
jgi:hypothetical protein